MYNVDIDCICGDKQLNRGKPIRGRLRPSR